MEQEFGHHPVEHIVTIWKEFNGSGPQPTPAPAPGLVPRKITVEYSVAIHADSGEKLASSQADRVAEANEDIQSRFAPIFKDQQAGSGVVRIEVSGDET